MVLEGYSILIFIYIFLGVLGVLSLIFTIRIGLAIISLDKSLRKYVDLEYKKYLEEGNHNDEKNAISN